MPATPLRGGLIGCGFVSKHHIEGWQASSQARLVALCDQDPNRLEQASQSSAGARLYTDAAAMLRDESLDFVEICTRPASHLPLVQLAADRGVHVLCQKPAAIARADLLAMIDVSNRAGIRLMFHENWRFRPWNRALRWALDSGAIGRPLRLRLNHHDTRGLKPDGFADQPYFAEMPQLILLEMGCHLIDTARYLLGEIFSVTAIIRRMGQGHLGEDLATLSVEFASGALGLLDMSWCAPTRAARPEWALNETIVEGTTGAIHLLPDGALEFLDLEHRAQRKAVPLPADDQVYASAYQATQNHFIHGLLTGEPHETSAADTLKTMDIVWAAYESAEERRTVVLPAFHAPH